MARKLNDKKAIEFINERGVLLTFPVNNRPEPLSLWSQFYPRTKMRWEWDGDTHDGVAQMWMLMKRISDCREVVYSKWYQGRATFFARDLFVAFLSEAMRARTDLTEGLSHSAREILEALENDSPLSTKELKKITELTGRDNEPQYSRAMKELFSRFLIVAYGEVEDGAFPSLAVGATRMLYEDLWLLASEMKSAQAQKIILKYLDEKDLFTRFLKKQISALATT